MSEAPPNQPRRTMVRMTVSLALLTAGVAGGVWYSRAERIEGCAGIGSASERDLCYFDAVTTGAVDDPAAAYVQLSLIADPVVRSAGVVAWMRVHPKADMQATAPLCNLLTGTEKMACERRVNSPHLHR